MSTKAILFGASPEADRSYLKKLHDLYPDAFVICADRGAEIAATAGFHPNIVIGDMDSLKRIPSDVEVIKCAPEKDDQDLKICARIALSRGYRDIIIVCASGGRLDHAIANFYLLEYFFENEAKAELLDAKNRVFMHEGGNMTLKTDPDYQYFGLLPLDYTLTGVTLRGLKYPLNHVILKRPEVISVSNEPIASEYSVEIENGRALIVLSRD
ncbi:MAG: thiamine diphosphokinase [Clostridiales bacterium]|nr:thiamine diphosphokinase [Clostridiales bacterium]